jgi:hypothetical protein
MLTCLRSGAPSLSILGKNVLFLAKFMQPANFFFGTFFFFREKKKATRGIGGKAPKTGSGAVAPKKRRSPGKAFPEGGHGGPPCRARGSAPKKRSGEEFPEKGPGGNTPEKKPRFFTFFLFYSFSGESFG